MSSAAAETNEAGGGGEQSEPMPTFSSPEEEMAYWKKELSRINDVHSSVSARDENDDDRNNDKLHVPLREVDRADNEFLNTVPEAAKTNQYWYSAHTISVLAAEACDQAGCEGRIACVSTPSIFFSLPREFQDRAVVLDFDRTFAERTANFVPYDFNHPTDIATELQHTFDVVVIDPPFITEEVWTKYAATARLLLTPGGAGKLICTTISENENMMRRLLDVRSQQFRPSIPNLVYQYNVYTNYESERLQELNHEIDAAPASSCESRSKDGPKEEDAEQVVPPS